MGQFSGQFAGVAIAGFVKSPVLIKLDCVRSIFGIIFGSSVGRVVLHSGFPLIGVSQLF